MQVIEWLRAMPQKLLGLFLFLTQGPDLGEELIGLVATQLNAVRGAA
jgi:hypothetical protein